MAETSEPVVRVKVTATAGYLITDSVFEIDAQVARQLDAEDFIDVIDEGDYGANPINILLGPGLTFDSGLTYNPEPQ